MMSSDKMTFDDPTGEQAGKQLSIAAIIPVYNRPDIVIEAIQSVVTQTRAPSQLLVIDDGSTDQTAQSIENWLAQQKLTFPAQLIKQTNQGASSARNHGVQMAGDCDLIAFLDSDDLWPSDYLQRMHLSFVNNKNQVAASSARIDHDLASGRTSLHDLTPIDNKTTQFIFGTGSPGTPNTVLKKSAFEAVKGFDEKQKCGEDYQLFLRISLIGCWGYVSGDPVQVRRNFPSTAQKQAGQLSKKYGDRRLRLARILDHFIHEENGKSLVPESLWKKRIGQLWFSAGKYAIKQKDWQTACEVLDKAHDYRPFHIRTILFRWLSRMKSN